MIPVEKLNAAVLKNAIQRVLTNHEYKENAVRGQRTKGINVYAKCKNLADINIKCTVILAQVIALKSV